MITLESIFQNKKGGKVGSFKSLFLKRETYKRKIPSLSNLVLENLKPYFDSGELTIKDILIASHLWGLYIVPEVHLPERLHNYLQKIATETSFIYHEDFWK